MTAIGTRDTSAPSAATIRLVTIALAALVFGWKWYKLSPQGIELGRLREQPMAPDLLNGRRFLSHHRIGASKVAAGEFLEADQTEPIAHDQDKYVPQVCLEVGVAALALDSCAYVSYHKAAGWYRVACSRSDGRPGGGAPAPIGRAEGDRFAMTAAIAVARAYGVKDV